MCLSEPPHTAICDLANIFRQPSHIVSLTLFSLPNETEEEDEHRTCSRSATTAEGRVCYNWQQGQPTSLPSGLYNPPRRVSPSSPYSSPQTQRRHNGKVYNSLEMDKLLTQLDEVSQSLERTQSRCEAIARRCGNKTRENSEHSAEGGGGEETDCTDEDSRVEHLLQVAETLTSQIIKQQMKKQNHSRSSPKPGRFVLVCVCVCFNLADSTCPSVAMYNTCCMLSCRLCVYSTFVWGWYQLVYTL